MITLYTREQRFLHFFVLENAEFNSDFEFVEKVAIVSKVIERHFPPITSVVATFLHFFLANLESQIVFPIPQGISEQFFSQLQ